MYDLGFSVRGLGLKELNSVFKVRVWGSRSRVRGSEFRILDLKLRV